ncbi:Isochorismatase hydrolase [Paramyrothecium foliicola]|nr:Isochorismatase hydrolase [Paramyrothecium foliicola]
MKAALIVVDMQNNFSEMVSASLDNVCTLIKHFRSAKLPVIFTQHGHSDEELTPPFKNQLVKKWGADGSIRIGTKGWEFIPKIKELVQDSPVVPKNTYDGFLGTDLEDILRKQDVERVVVCGVMTDCCCDTTGRAAFNRGFETWLVSDACGSGSNAQHKAGLNAFGFAFGPIVSSKEVLGEIQG